MNSRVLPSAFMIMGMIKNPGQSLRWATRVIRASPSGRGTSTIDATANAALLGLDLTASGLDLLRA